MIDVANVVINLRGFPEDEKEDVRRCLATLYSVRAGEQPLDRDFGIDDSFLDMPMPTAKNMFALEVIAKTKKYEPRVSIRKVEYESGSEGQLRPVIYGERGKDV